jgi:transposase
MPKPYSIDLGEKVVAAIDRKEGTQRGLAKVFGVSLYFVACVLKRRPDRGSVAPKPHAGGQKAPFDKQAFEHVRELIRTLTRCN